MYLTKTETELVMRARGWGSTRYSSCREVKELTYQGLLGGAYNANQRGDENEAGLIQGVLLKYKLDNPAIGEGFLTYTYPLTITLSPHLRRAVAYYHRNFGGRGFGSWPSNHTIEWVLFLLSGQLSGVISICKNDLQLTRDMLQQAQKIVRVSSCRVCGSPIEVSTCIVCGSCAPTKNPYGLDFS